VQRNFINKDGVPTHKFESRKNIGLFYLDFKSLTLKQQHLEAGWMKISPTALYKNIILWEKEAEHHREW